MLSPLVLAAFNASAFAPTDAVWIGIEPQRIQWSHPAVQSRHLRSDRWRRFTAAEGAGWMARFDEATGVPREMWGPGIDVSTHSSSAVLASVEAILDDHAGLLGIAGNERIATTANHHAPSDTWYLAWDVRREGLSTYRGGIGARVKHGRLIGILAATAPDAPLAGAYVLSGTDAIAEAIAQGPAPGADHTDRQVEAILLEGHDETGLHLQRTWQVTTKTTAPPGHWVSFVDGETGSLLSVHNEVRFITGTVSGQHHERTLDGSPLVASPIPYAFVAGDVDSDYTDIAGVFDVTASGTYASELDGTYLRVLDDTGPEGILGDNDTTMLWTTAATDQSEIDVYVFTHHARDWADAVAPTVPLVNNKIDANVNISANCNAYYDGNINFYVAGSGCNNTAQIADVVYHEWGHGFHSSSIQTGFFDGSVSEGAADILAFLQTEDNIIAPYFYTQGSGIRDVAPNKSYPGDFGASVHANGTIIGGAIWDLWPILQARLGTGAGTAATEDIYAGILRGGPDIPGTYFEALVADDDDGDLGNGTPHQCDIVDAFDLHGLVNVSFVASHDPLVSSPEGVPAVIDVELIDVTGGCFAATAIEAHVTYRVDGGPWLQSPALITGNDVTTDIPAQPRGAIIEYYASGRDSNGSDWTVPEGGLLAPYTYHSGDLIEVMCEGFEVDDGGFVHQASVGSDDWAWGSPDGSGGDPSFAFEGTNVWGTDLGGATDGIYTHDSTSFLQSPVYETGHFTEVVLQYRRWLNIEDAYYDRGFIQADGVPVWGNRVGTGPEHHQDREWVSHTVDLDGMADRDTIQLTWNLETDPGLQMGGWTLDDVCLMAAATPDNRLGITDFVVTDLGGPIGLSWTQPPFAPVEEIRVVRRTDQYPASVDDGEVVVTIQAPTLGAFVEEEHPNYDGSAGFYAVYASDGTDWLSWTIEGWNAGYADANEGQPKPPPPATTPSTDTEPTPGTTASGTGTDVGGPDPADPIEGGGCGCAAGGLSPIGLAPLGLLLLVRRRRD